MGLSLGQIDYVNADPFFEDLAFPKGIELVAAKPAILNGMLLDGELDASWISSIELIRNPEILLRRGSFCIAAPEKVSSVLLLSPCPFEDLDQTTVFLSAYSSTSVALLKILLKESGFKNRFRRFDHQGTLPPGPILLIGDEALAARETPAHPFRYDLGELWRQKTGSPMVFAVFALRRDREEARTKDGTLARALEKMAENRRAFERDPVLSQAFQRRPGGLSPTEYQRYFRGFCFDWNPDTERGFETFARLGKKYGLNEAEPRVEDIGALNRSPPSAPPPAASPWEGLS